MSAGVGPRRLAQQLSTYVRVLRRDGDMLRRKRGEQSGECTRQDGCLLRMQILGEDGNWRPVAHSEMPDEGAGKE